MEFVISLAEVCISPNNFNNSINTNLTIIVDIEYYHYKAQPLLWKNLLRWTSTTDTQNDVDYWDSPGPLKDVDRVSREKTAAREVGIHPSQGGWNLPRSHPRHLLNFPQGKFAIIQFYDFP